MEPYVRPDSPTLGFDDMYFHAPITKQDLPELPVPPKFQEIEYPLHTIHESESEDSESDQPFSSEEEDESAYLIAQSIDRCCEHLSGLRRQFSRHAASLSETLSKPPSAVAAVSRSRSGKTVEELKALDKKVRIERLRRSGWQRQRFDARRYEELCEAVLAELS